VNIKLYCKDILKFVMLDFDMYSLIYSLLERYTINHGVYTRPVVKNAPTDITYKNVYTFPIK
jgi:hypothetical protein